MTANDLFMDRYPDLPRTPVPVEPYVSEAVFERERDAIFRKSWINVGREADIATPGEYFVRDIEIAAYTLRKRFRICFRFTKILGRHSLSLPKNTVLASGLAPTIPVIGGCVLLGGKKQTSTRRSSTRSSKDTEALLLSRAGICATRQVEMTATS